MWPDEYAVSNTGYIKGFQTASKKDWRDNVEIAKQKYNQKFYLDFQKEWAKKCHAKGWFFYRENSKTDSLSGWLAHLPIAYVDYIEIAFGHKKAKPIIDDLNHIGGKRIYFKQYFQHTNRCSTQEPAWLTPDVKAKRAKAQERIEANRAIADNYAKNYGPDFLATFRQDLKRKCNARSWFKYYDHTRTINKSGWHIVLPDLENSPHAKLGIYEGGKAMPLESVFPQEANAIQQILHTIRGNRIKLKDYFRFIEDCP